jgi:hypothetical protein
MRECPNYSLRQVQLVLTNVPSMRNISETIIKELYDEITANK